MKIRNFGPNLAHIWPKTGIFCPFQLPPDQKTMQTRCLEGFSVKWVQKLFGPNIGIFGPFDPMPDQNLMRTRCQGAFFCYVGTKTLGILAKKRQNFAQNMLSWAHIGLAGSFGALLVWLEVVARGLYLARPIYFIELIMRMLIGRIFGSIIKVKICLLHQELL